MKRYGTEVITDFMVAFYSTYYKKKLHVENCCKLLSS